MKRVRGCVHGVTLTVHPRTSIRCPLSARSLQASLSESILLLKTKGLPVFTLALMPGSRDLREANGDRFALATYFRSLRLVWQGIQWYSTVVLGWEGEAGTVPIAVDQEAGNGLEPGADL